jgi:hypothetical protein
VQKPPVSRADATEKYADEICTDKKEKKIFLVQKEIQMGSGSKSSIRKGFLKYEEMRNYCIKPYSI